MDLRWHQSLGRVGISLDGLVENCKERAWTEMLLRIAFYGLQVFGLAFPKFCRLRCSISIDYLFQNSMVVDKKPIVPPHATSHIPSAPPQTLKNANDGENGVSGDDQLYSSSARSSVDLSRPTSLSNLPLLPTVPTSP